MQSAKIASRKKISVERYLKFLQSRPRIDLPVYDLNQIISLHGFRKVDRTPKKILTEALEEMDLIHLSRSTIDYSSNIFPSTPITLEDLVDDLNKLNWQECRVTSVQALHSSKGGRTSTGPADSCRQSVSIDIGRTLNSKGDFISTVQAADLSSTGVAELKKQSPAAAAGKTKSFGCLGGSAAGLAFKPAADGEIFTRPAESNEQPAAAPRKRKSLDEISCLPAHLHRTSTAEFKNKQRSAATRGRIQPLKRR